VTQNLWILSSNFGKEKYCRFDISFIYYGFSFTELKETIWNYWRFIQFLHYFISGLPTFAGTKTGQKIWVPPFIFLKFFLFNYKIYPLFNHFQVVFSVSFRTISLFFLTKSWNWVNFKWKFNFTQISFLRFCVKKGKNSTFRTFNVQSKLVIEFVMRKTYVRNLSILRSKYSFD
jgi:hypothetical protein